MDAIQLKACRIANIATQEYIDFDDLDEIARLAREIYNERQFQIVVEDGVQSASAEDRAAVRCEAVGRAA